MRYFLVSFYFKGESGNGYGNIHFECDIFPSREYILTVYNTINPTTTVDIMCIISVYEFKDEIDYKSYDGKVLIEE